MTTSGVSRSAFLRPWLIWTAGFVSFPIAGVAAGAVLMITGTGRVDSPVAALIAGLVTGAVIGAGQSLASSRRLEPGRLFSVRWIIASALGMGLGLLLGAAAVGSGTSLADLALMGAITGLVLGGAQALALPVRRTSRIVWAAAVSALWALGWTVTTLAGIDVAQQFSVFGASGAVTFSAISGLLLHRLLPVGATSTTTTASSGTRRAPSQIGDHS